MFFFNNSKGLTIIFNGFAYGKNEQSLIIHDDFYGFCGYCDINQENDTKLEIDLHLSHEVSNYFGNSIKRIISKNINKYMKHQIKWHLFIHGNGTCNIGNPKNLLKLEINKEEIRQVS